MTYEYWCEECEKPFEKDFPFGKAPKTTTCECGKSRCSLYPGNAAFILGGPTGDWPSKSTRFKKEMTDKNDAAGRKMRGTWEGTQPKLVDQS